MLKMAINVLYNNFVRKDERVKYEYERYVMEHIDEHSKHRFKHWLFLFRLNWHYVVCKKSIPLKYFDEQKVNVNVTSGKKSITELFRCMDTVHFAKEFYQYDLLIFYISDVLLFRTIYSKELIYEIVGRNIGINDFAILRKRVAEELEKKNKYNGIVTPIKVDMIYREIAKLLEIDIDYCINKERDLFKNSIVINDYVKEIVNMLEYNGKKIVFVDDSIYDSNIYKEILTENGISNSCDIVVSNEAGVEIRSVEFFKKLKEQYDFNSCLYFDNDIRRINLFKEVFEGATWKYRDIRSLERNHKNVRVRSIVDELYSNIVSFYLYKGNSTFSKAYEIGFVYFGIVLAGYFQMVKREIIKNGCDYVLFSEESSGLLKRCLYDDLKNYKKEIIWISEKMALKVMAIKSPIYFYKYFIEPYIYAKNTVAFYFDKADIEFLTEKAKDYGIKQYMPIERNQQVYGSFMHFIEAYYEEISKKYLDDLDPIVSLIKNEIKENSNITILSSVGKGVYREALEYILNSVLHYDCKVKELSIINDCTYNDCLLSDVSSALIDGDNRFRKEILGNKVFINRMHGVFVNVGPEFEKISLSENGDYIFKYSGAKPEYYEYMADLQSGMYDFFAKYLRALEVIGCKDIDITSSDAVAILESFYNEKFKKDNKCIKNIWG